MNPQWQEVIERVLEQVRGAARFRWWALLVTWVVCLLGWFWVSVMPNVYGAEARIYVDPNTSLGPVLQGLTIGQDIGAKISLASQTIMGQAQIEKLASALDLDRTATTPEDRARMLGVIRSRINLGGWASGMGMVYTINYYSPSREEGLKAVTYLLNTFVNETRGGKTAATETANKFLRDQIQEYEARLRDAEQRLAEFKRLNVGQMPGAQGDYFSRLQIQMETVDKLRSQLAVANTRRDELQRQLRGRQAAPGESSPAPLEFNTPTSAAIVEAEAKLQELLLRFTDIHPDVTATRETLAQLRTRREQEVAALASGGLAQGSTDNPVLQKIQQAMNETSVEIAALRAQLSDAQRSVAELRARVNVVPEVEAEYTRLNRDYDVTRASYNELVARLDKANLGQEAEKTESAKFEIINPPTAGFQPVAPKRPLLMIAVLGVGLAAGCVLAYVLHMLQPVFHSSRALRDFAGLPVLGVVSMTWLERYESRLRRGYAKFALGLIGLGVVLVVFLQLQPRMPLMSIT